MIWRSEIFNFRTGQIYLVTLFCWCLYPLLVE